MNAPVLIEFMDSMMNVRPFLNFFFIFLIGISFHLHFIRFL